MRIFTLGLICIMILSFSLCSCAKKQESQAPTKPAVSETQPAAKQETASPAESVTKGAKGDYTTMVCDRCGGSGRCQACGGGGRSVSGTCYACDGTGRCFYCGGQGYY